MHTFVRSKATAGHGFTLSELLIALAILGLIATFTIPKVLQSVGSSSNKTVVKEAASMINGAYDSVLADQNGVLDATNDKITKLAAKFNYVEAVTTGTLTAPTGTTFSTAPNCASITCYRLHNGAVIAFSSADDFDGSLTDGAMVFHVDPDGTGTAELVSLVLGSNGRMISAGGLSQFTTLQTNGRTSPDGLDAADTDPTWWAWSG